MDDHPIYTGNKLVTSQIESIANSVQLNWGVQIIADAANTMPVYIVEPGKTIDDGYPINPGDRIEFRVDDLSKVYVTAAVSGGSGTEAMSLRYMAW